jgi:hypothetical protein
LPDVKIDFDIVELLPRPRKPTTDATRRPMQEIAFRANAWLLTDDQTLRALFLADEAIADIAEELDRTMDAVRTRIHDLGLRRNSVQPWTSLDDQELIQRYGTEPTADLARDLGRSCAATYARAGLLGLTEGQPPAWTDWEDDQLREGYRRAIAVADIAVMIGRPVSGTASRACSLGLKHPSNADGWTGEEVARAIELAEGGALYVDIIEQLASEGFPRRSKAGFGSKIRSTGYGRGWGRSWTPEEDELLKKSYREGRSLTPLQTRLGRSQHSIRWRSEHLGLIGTHPNKNGFRGGPDWTEEDIAFLKANYGKLKTADLAKAMGRSKGAVFTRANVLGLQHGYIRPWEGEDHDLLVYAFENGIAIADVAKALERKAMSVSKYATKHGMSFGRRDRLDGEVTRARLKSMKEERERSVRMPSRRIKAHEHPNDTANGQPGHDQQGDEAVQRDRRRHHLRAIAERSARRREERRNRYRYQRRSCRADRIGRRVRNSIS